MVKYYIHTVILLVQIQLNLTIFNATIRFFNIFFTNSFFILFFFICYYLFSIFILQKILTILKFNVKKLKLNFNNTIICLINSNNCIAILNKKILESFILVIKKHIVLKSFI